MNKDDVMFRSSGANPPEPKAPAKRLRIWRIFVSLVVASGLGLGIVLGVQNREDHVLTAQITHTEAELRAMGGRIANIKDREFKTMAEYVAAYGQIEPLLTEYDHELQEYSELYNSAQQRDQKRGLINVAEHIGIDRAHSPDQRRHEEGSLNINKKRFKGKLGS